MAKKDEKGMQRIAEIARGASKRSALYLWLHANHDEFLALMEETRPNWKRLAEGFAEIGIVTPEGKPLTAETVRVTWYRVRRDVAKARAKKQEKPAAAVTPV